MTLLPSVRRCFLLLVLLATVAIAQPPKQQMDEDFAKSVKEWTTKPEFLSPLVDHLPKAAGIPSPKDVLGYHIGTPQKLTYTEGIYKYFRTLADKSPRVKLFVAGKTDEGRDIIVVAIANEETIRNLEQYRGYLTQLADPRRITDEQAREVIAKAKPVYHFTAGLHSAETGPPEMVMELGYRLVVEDSPLINSIRDNVIVMITPVLEPDGRDRYVDWYYRHKIDQKTEEENIVGPPYWGKYIFHDNNRDINYSQITMKASLDWYLKWHPPIVHDLHESVPFMYTFSGQAPQNPTLDPILYGELPWFSNFEMAQMIKYGMPGVWTHGFVDMWSPGYLGFMSSNHNGILRMYETFGNGGANTMKRTVAPPGGGAGQTSREWYRPLPPYKEVVWSMRNNTNYMETGVLSALQLTSEFPKVVLENFYRKSRNSIEDGKNNAPYGFIIKPDRDMTRVFQVVKLLRQQGIEIGLSEDEITLKEGKFPAGTYYIKRDQPYGRLAKILLEKQAFPDPNLRTYDDTGWTMGLMTHTNIIEVSDKAILNLPTPSSTQRPLPPPPPFAQANTIVIPNYGSNNLIALRYKLRGLQIRAVENSFRPENIYADLPAGSFVIATQQQGRNVLNEIQNAAYEFTLPVFAVDKIPDVPMHDVDLPRLAVYTTWGSTQEVGWVRHALDQFGVQYDLIYKERVKQGNLRGTYDVILMPNQGGSGKRIVFDIESKGKPIAYTKSDKFKTMGLYGESEDITGGMGLSGVVEFEKFINSGGLLITLGTASFFPAEFGLTRTIDAGRTSPQFYAPGPIVEAEILQPTHPIFYGYDKKTIPVRYANGPLLNVPEAERARQVLMRFPGGDKTVLSGLMKGATEITNRPAIVDVPVGNGRVLLFATNPCYRWQNHGEFGMLFNSILHYNDFKVTGQKPSAKAESTGRN